MKTINTVATTLDMLIGCGAFASQADDHIDRARDNRWYSKMAVTEGRDAAERELASLTRHHRTFAASIEPVAHGIAALAKAKESVVIDITDCTPPRFIPMSDGPGMRRRFIALNASPTGFVSPLKGGETWASYGDLGLQAVILQAERTREGWEASMMLAMPVWTDSSQNPQEGPNFFGMVDTQGTSSGDRYTLFQNGRTVTDANFVMRCLLGMTELPDGAGWKSSSGQIRKLGFPDAENYVASKLPELGDYFLSLAAELNSSK